MSYDKLWISKGDDKFIERNGQPEAFDAEFDALPNRVELTHGENSLTNELFAFQSEAEAIHFFNEGCLQWQHAEGCGGGCGFEGVVRYEGDNVVASRSVAPSNSSLSSEVGSSSQNEGD